jgi:hypothetical protein
MTRLERSKELMRRVREIVLGHHEGEVVEMTPVDAYVLMMYSRIRSLLQGVCVLLNDRLPEEAIILGREMFTDSLNLMEIASREADRASLILGLISGDCSEWEKLDCQALSLGERDESDVRVHEHVAKRRKEIEGYRQRHGIGPLKTLRQEKQLAKNHGRLGEYLDFVFAHRMVHRPGIAQAGRTLKRDTEVLAVHLRNPDPDSLAAASPFVMTSALHAHKAVASIFAWTETLPEEIDRLLEEIRELLPAELPSPDQSS